MPPLPRPAAAYYLIPNLQTIVTREEEERHKNLTLETNTSRCRRRISSTRDVVLRWSRRYCQRRKVHHRLPATPASGTLAAPRYHTIICAATIDRRCPSRPCGKACQWRWADLYPESWWRWPPHRIGRERRPRPTRYPPPRSTSPGAIHLDEMWPWRIWTPPR